jgi:hypothetical protein
VGARSWLGKRRYPYMNEKPQKPKIKTIKDIEKLMFLMKKHKIDFLEVEGVKITISKHDFSTNTQKQKSQHEADDELLFWSARQ